jgi:hypothetical protein
LYKTINGTRVEIPDYVIKEVYVATVEHPHGSYYDDFFNEIVRRTGIEVDEEQAIAIWKQQLVYQLVSRIGGRNETKQFYAVPDEDDGKQRRLSTKVLSKEMLKEILAKFIERRDRINRCIVAVQALIRTKPFDFGIDEEVEIKRPVADEQRGSGERASA